MKEPERQSGLAPEERAGRRFRGPFGELLHAINQPITGLQCLLEIGMAAPRTAGEYVVLLRDALTLTERMAALSRAMEQRLDVECGGETKMRSTRSSTRGNRE